MTGSPDEHADLADRLARGEEEALGRLFSLHRERLWRMVNFRIDRRLRGRISADDVLQDAYLDAARRIEHYDRETFSSPFMWLRSVLKQTLIDAHRRHLGARKRDAKREIALEALRPQATSASIAVQLVGDITSPSQAAVRAESFDAVQQAIETMDPIDQEVLAMRHFEELTNNEVAEALSIQPKAASIRYIRAIRRLKEIVSDVPGLLDEGARA